MSNKYFWENFCDNYNIKSLHLMHMKVVTPLYHAKKGYFLPCKYISGYISVCKFVSTSLVIYVN